MTSLGKKNEQKLQEQANIQIDKFKTDYDDNVNIITSQLDIYNSLFINLKNVVDLERTYKNENKSLLKKLKENTHDILTNERKTYYEDQQNDVLNNYYFYILFSIYIIIVLVIIFFSLVYPNQSSLKMRLLIILVFILLPFVSTWLLEKIVYIIYLLISMLPKNVYKNI
jgi:hypothetical protein